MHLHMNRSTRIVILLVIDVLFFFVELIVGERRVPQYPTRPTHFRSAGYAVGSLALVADSFHMLK